jgi:hypothetical protein
MATGIVVARIAVRRRILVGLAEIASPNPQLRRPEHEVRAVDAIGGEAWGS